MYRGTCVDRGHAWTGRHAWAGAVHEAVQCAGAGHRLAGSPPPASTDARPADHALQT